MIFYLRVIAMKDLNTFLEILSENRKLHISIADVSGILNGKLLNINPKFKIHSKAFCDTAKMTSDGYNLCIRCKTICNKRALAKGRPFFGLCPFGIYELVFPVTINDAVLCIIYIGNILKDEESTFLKLYDTSIKTDGNFKELKKHLYAAEIFENDEKYLAIAEIISDYIQMLYKISPPAIQEYHWAVKAAIDHIETNFYHPLSLKSISGMCFINEKYLGRIFKEQTGMTFHEYLTEKRLCHAIYILENSHYNILKTALDSGFNSSSYFTRIFTSKFGISPKEYRKLHNKNS